MERATLLLLHTTPHCPVPTFQSLLAVFCLLLTGCPSTETGNDGSSAGLAQVGTLRLAVVDDPALAKAIEQFRGEWQGQTGADFVVQQLTSDRLADASQISADAFICPTGQLGALAAKDLLVPVPDNLRAAGHSQWPQVFSLLRSRVAVWGNQVVGVPFGSPVLVCYCRADLLEKLGREAPTTWAEYDELVTLLADREKLGDAAPPQDQPWYASLAPLGDGWAGQVLLARAAAYATHRENYSTLFEISTMRPLVAGPPFVKALEQLKAAAADGPPEQLTYDPAAVRKAFWEGRCGLALSWPTAAGSESIQAAEGVRVHFVELPGAPQVYDVVNKRWERRGKDEAPQVPLLGVAGRLGTVTRQSQWPEATFQLLLWLTDDSHAVDVSAASPATTLFRPSQIAQAKSWVEPSVPPEVATEYGGQTQTTLDQQQRLFSPRIPGRMEYLAALDKAVQQAVRGEKSPEEALTEAATQWDQITDQLGRKEQAKAYYHSLGLD